MSLIALILLTPSHWESTLTSLLSIHYCPQCDVDIFRFRCVYANEFDTNMYGDVKHLDKVEVLSPIHKCNIQSEPTKTYRAMKHPDKHEVLKPFHKLNIQHQEKYPRLKSTSS